MIRTKMDPQIDPVDAFQAAAAALEAFYDHLDEIYEVFRQLVQEAQNDPAMDED